MESVINNNTLHKICFFDIETISQFNGEDIEKEDTSLKKYYDLWKHKASNKYEKDLNQGLSPKDIYIKYSPLYAEFGKVFVIAFGILETDSITHQWVSKIISICKPTEKETIEFFFTKFHELEKNGFILCGHNIKKFDIPYLLKRGIINNITVPHSFNNIGKKPWNTNEIDTMEVWAGGNSFGDSLVSLDTLTYTLSIPSPKDDICGGDVNRLYWTFGDNISLEDYRIRCASYCSKDVLATQQIMLRLGAYPIINDPKNLILKIIK